MKTLNAKLNKRERRAAQLLAHYATCERLAAYLGMPAGKIDGKKISVALWKAERVGANRALRMCNDSSYTQEMQSQDRHDVCLMVEGALGVIPPGFFINSDPRGHSCKIDNESAEGKALIEAVKLHTDFGGYGILSPEITGD